MSTGNTAYKDLGCSLSPWMLPFRNWAGPYSELGQTSSRMENRTLAEEAPRRLADHSCLAAAWEWHACVRGPVAQMGDSAPPLIGGSSCARAPCLRVTHRALHACSGTQMNELVLRLPCHDPPSHRAYRLYTRLTRTGRGICRALPANGQPRCKHSHLGASETLAIPGGLEPPTNGLGNRCSVLLSYGTAQGG